MLSPYLLEEGAVSARRTDVLDIREIVRRLRMNEKVRGIARDLNVSRKTVRLYQAVAKKEGWLTAAELPEAREIHLRLQAHLPPKPAGPPSPLEQHRPFIEEMRKKSVEIRALHQLLRERGYAGSYSSVRRFVNRLEAHLPECFVRVETPPGQEAQVDFGYAGLLLDRAAQRMRKAWVFVMTLGFSRHMYAEIVFDQSLETWAALHVRAFEWFGGVPHRVVPDNLKAAVLRAVVHDAEATRTYRALAEHYGFAISPCPPESPRLKGKTESGVRYVHRNALAGRTFADSDAANAHLKGWLLDTAGVRDHGTTHEAPLARFERERGALKPLPVARYEIAVWKQGKVHGDGYVVFDYAFYSAPCRLVGRTLWLCATPTRVELYHDHERIATHPRASERGTRSTLPDHLPPHKVEGILPDAEKIRAEAQRCGPATREFVERLLGERPMDRVRSAQAVLRLGRWWGAARLEGACRRALEYGEIRYWTIWNILKGGLDREAAIPAAPPPPPKTAVFARPIADFILGNRN